MIIQKGITRQTTHRKYVIGAHPIIHTFIQQLKVTELIATYIKQDARLILPGRNWGQVLQSSNETIECYTNLT